MPQSDETCKAISNPAKILRGYMKATGLTDAKQLAEALDIPLRTIQRLKLECAISGVSESANDAKRAISGVSDRIESAKDAISGASLGEVFACGDNTTRATKELPSEVVISSSRQQQSRVEDVHAAVIAAAGQALNPVAIGLHVVSDVLGWMAAGADLTLDIVPTIKALSAGKHHSVNSWRFYAAAVAQARDARKRGLPAVANVGKIDRETESNIKFLESVRRNRLAREAASA